jgi:hypothetical protein
MQHVDGRNVAAFEGIRSAQWVGARQAIRSAH